GLGSSQNIVVYGTGDSDHRKAKLPVKGNGPLETAVSPDHDEGINALGDQLVVGPLPSLFTAKIIAAGRFKDGAPFVDDIVHIPGVQDLEIPIDHSLVPSIDTHTFYLEIGTGTDHGTNGGIHSRGVPSRCQHPYFLNI